MCHVQVYLISGPRHSAGLINEGEDSQAGIDRGPLQQVQAILVVNKLHIAPVNALSSILFLQSKDNNSSDDNSVMVKCHRGYELKDMTIARCKQTKDEFSAQGRVTLACQ